MQQILGYSVSLLGEIMRTRMPSSEQQRSFLPVILSDSQLSCRHIAVGLGRKDHEARGLSRKKCSPRLRQIVGAHPLMCHVRHELLEVRCIRHIYHRQLSRKGIIYFDLNLFRMVKADRVPRAYQLVERGLGSRLIRIVYDTFPGFQERHIRFRLLLTALVSVSDILIVFHHFHTSSQWRITGVTVIRPLVTRCASIIRFKDKKMIAAAYLGALPDYLVAYP